MSATGWARLDAELAHWRDAGATATLWWRDDDAVADSEALRRLIACAEAGNVPVGLAVIPAGLEDSLVARVRAHPALSVLLHGYRHQSHSPAGEKSAEFGPHRNVGEMEDEIGRGHEILRARFGARYVPVLVPPWNRIAATLLPRLPMLGLDACSTYTARGEPWAAPGLRQINCHVDVIDWRGTRGHRGDDACLGDLVEHLRARRRATVDSSEPTGILTHHLVHDDGCRHFLERLVERLAGDGAVRWLTPAEAVHA